VWGYSCGNSGKNAGWVLEGKIGTLQKGEGWVYACLRAKKKEKEKRAIASRRRKARRECSDGTVFKARN